MSETLSQLQKQPSLHAGDGEGQGGAAARRLSLPKDSDLPPVIREVVSNAPQSRKTPSFVACLAPLCALATRLRLHYCYDSRPSSLLLHVIIEGAQSSGKSYAADIEDLIMADTLKARDKAQRRLEQDYREKKRRRRANETLEEEPKTTIRVIPPTVSKTVLTKRADLYERILGDTPTFWMFAEELAQVTDAGKSGYSNLRTLMRTGWDLGSLFGMDFASDNSYSAIVDINICCMFCATPAALDDYMDSKAIEGGNITRCIVCPLDEELGADGAFFKPYTPGQMDTIRRTLGMMMADTYDNEGRLMPVKDMDTSWMDNAVRRWCRKKGRLASLTGSAATDVFRKRSSVSAFRTAALCYYLYGMERQLSAGDAGRSEAEIQRLCLEIYEFMAEYVLHGLLERWGKRFEELGAKRALARLSDKKEDGIYFGLTNVFTRSQLELLCRERNLTTAPRQFLYMWTKSGDIKPLDKNTFEKLRK